MASPTDTLSKNVIEGEGHAHLKGHAALVSEITLPIPPLELTEGQPPEQSPRAVPEEVDTTSQRVPVKEDITADDEGVPRDNADKLPTQATFVQEATAVNDDGDADPEVLSKSELEWASRYEFLKERGYLLRPRYRPGWVASWLPGSYDLAAEDGVLMRRSHLLDAVRVADGRTVLLKRVVRTSSETSIGQFLWSEDLKKDPRNHTCPLLDVLENESEPDHLILVLPNLRRLDEPRPASVRECVDLVEQTLEGLVFMHEHKVAHRDGAQGNVMMDARAMFPKGWHPQRTAILLNGDRIKNMNASRTAAGSVRYYYIDFGISSHNEDSVQGLNGQERAPELSDDIPYDPYKLDVYILGMLYQHFLVEKHVGVDFVLPLIKYMTPETPSERPSAVEALEMFKTIRAKMTNHELSQRLRSVGPEEPTATRIVKDTYYRICDRWWMLKPKKKLEPLA
ncbi:hypothetical protein FRB94_013490 [Tulasnella sp. JGI-2019a]|nr:hypothetical protein FRB94_013490 [Tulasnella sp. JGI-2019a]